MDDKYRIRVAVWLFLYNDRGEVLLSQRQNTGWKDGWYTLPSGHLEADESIVEAMMREAKEEIMVDFELTEKDVVHVQHRQSDKNYIDVYFLKDGFTGEVKNGEPDKCAELKWCTKDRLPEETVENLVDVFGQIAEGKQYSEFNWG